MTVNKISQKLLKKVIDNHNLRRLFNFFLTVFDQLCPWYVVLINYAMVDFKNTQNVMTDYSL